MAREVQSTQNRYWEALSPEALRDYDEILMYAYDFIKLGRQIKGLEEKKDNCWQVRYSIRLRNQWQQADLLNISRLIPGIEEFEAPPEATGTSRYQLAQEGWSDVIHGRPLGTEERRRGITISGDSPHTPGFISGIKEDIGKPPEQQ